MLFIIRPFAQITVKRKLVIPVAELGTTRVSRKGENYRSSLHNFDELWSSYLLFF